jgi:hypothetical protein
VKIAALPILKKTMVVIGLVVVTVRINVRAVLADI